MHSSSHPSNKQIGCSQRINFHPSSLLLGINTLAYVLCCLPAAFSQLVKERAIVKFSQPMNFYYLNLLLGVYQFVLLLVLSPLTYRLQVGTEGGREGGREGREKSASKEEGQLTAFPKNDSHRKSTTPHPGPGDGLERVCHD